MKTYTDFAVKKTCELLAIPSPSGYTDNAIEYLRAEFSALGFSARKTIKGGLLVDLGGEGNGLLLQAHCDTLGGMVCEVKRNGRLRLSNIGGMNPNNAESENAVVVTRSGKKYEGTFQIVNASIHVNGEPKYNDIKRTWDTMELVLDEDVACAEDVKKLGISAGDFVCFDPRTRVTESGYIKSRFLDDKLAVGVLLALAKYLKDEGVCLKRHIWAHVTVYEEVSHGGAAPVPEDVEEAIALDMGCVGEGLQCTERMVSICAKDSGGPYNREIVCALANAAESAGAKYAVDVYPHYRSDVEVSLRAGWDLRHGLIGAGVYASHGYERSHVDGVENMLKLLAAYIV